MAQYPSALVTTTQLPTRADSTATVTNHKNDHNAINAELIAIEATLGVNPHGNQGTVVERLEGTGPEYGGEALRQALYTMSGTTPTIRAQNFPLWYPSTAALGESVMTSQRVEFMAIYWPGGVPTGVVWEQAVTGSYTDAGTHSGFQLMGGSISGPVIGGTTTLSAITNSNTKLAPANMWQAGAGMNNKAFGGVVASLAAGIYYVVFFYSQSAVTTAPELGGTVALGADYFNKAGYGAPSGFPMWASLNAQTDMSSTQLISALSISTTNIHWCGLY